MSLGIAFKGPEGIVLAADSRVTLDAHLATGKTITVHFDNATKLLSLQEQPYVGIVTYGAGAIGMTAPRTGHSFIPEFEAELAAKHQGRAKVAEIAQGLSDFYAQQWQQAGMPAAGAADLVPMVFLIAGIDEGEAYGRVFEVSVPNSLTPVEKSPGNEFGITLGGQMEFVARLMGGFDPAAAELAKDELSLTDAQKTTLIQKWRQNLSIAIPYQFLPLQDCVDLSTFLVRMTTLIQGWTIGIRGVGGAVEVATITRTDGFRAIQYKTIEVKE